MPNNFVLNRVATPPSALTCSTIQCPPRPRVPPPGSPSFHLILCTTRLKMSRWPHASSPLRRSDYTVVPGAGTSGNVDYRCWPSHSQQGCVLSVHSAREAAHICNSHSQCNSFTLTGRRTWTGQFELLCVCFYLCLECLSFPLRFLSLRKHEKPNGFIVKCPKQPRNKHLQGNYPLNCLSSDPRG